MTKQEIFNRVWAHFVVNRAPKSMDRDVDGEYQCRYRTKDENGNQICCAVGLFIEDREYSAELEGLGLDALVRQGLLPSSFWTRMDVYNNQEFLSAIQNAHDNSADSNIVGMGVGTIETNLRRVAATYRLDVPRDERMSY